MLVEELKNFEYKLSKCLYELKTHESLKKHLGKVIALGIKFLNQKSPEDCPNEKFKEWGKSKLTTKAVYSITVSRTSPMPSLWNRSMDGASISDGD